ncbi:MAG: hypothetical protein AAGE52_20135 [Myxococcota bacterium]
MSEPFTLVVDDLSELDAWHDAGLETLDRLALTLDVRWFPTPEPLLRFLARIGPLRVLNLETEATLPLDVMCALAAHETLEELVLSGQTPVRDPQMAVVAASFPHLRNLEVHDGSLSLDAYRALTRAPFRTTLERLFVAFSSCSAEAISLLRSVPWPALRELFLSGLDAPGWDFVTRFDVAPVPLVASQDEATEIALQLARGEPSPHAFTRLMEHVALLDESTLLPLAPALEEALERWPDDARAVVTDAGHPKTVDLDPHPRWLLPRALRIHLYDEEDRRALLEGPPLPTTSLHLASDDLALDLRERFPHLKTLALQARRPWTSLRDLRLPEVEALDLWHWTGELFEKASYVGDFWEWLPDSIRTIRFDPWVNERDDELKRWFGPSKEGWRVVWVSAQW